MRPLQSRRSTQRAEGNFIRQVALRDGYICRMLRWSETFPRWSPCGKEAHDTMHILTRRDCGRAKFDPDVAMKACRTCHDIYDGRITPNGLKIKLPKGVYERALRAVNKGAKVKVRA